tara:strand:- start:244 stop:924 length:681 start_codon:yes stop_codon:yes gene_type:complete
MDILNFISWIKGGRVVNTVDPAKTLLPVGLKDNRRDDAYLAGAISVEDLVTQLTPTPTYKVYTALLTQSGGDAPKGINGDEAVPLTIGVTYEIVDNTGLDVTNVGSPNNNIGTKFVATGTTPNSWGNIDGWAILGYNTGAPVVTVLENTIGNIWFTYDVTGLYYANSFGLFNLDMTCVFMGTNTDNLISGYRANNNLVEITTYSVSSAVFDDNKLLNTPIEIRVYN